MLLGKETSQRELKKEISLIVDYSQHLSATIDDFRNFYKTDKVKETISFEEIINKAIKIIEPSLEKNGINILKSFNCYKKIDTYPSEVTQVILNLLKNAEDALTSNKIEEPEISIHTYYKGNKIYIKIRDNGGGIKKDYFPKLFDPYFSTKSTNEGSGLGLYMSKTIIEEHCNGTLGATSDTPCTTFLITMNTD